MPYEIPQQLQYEEKIIFGLTFRQIVYLAIFLLPSIIISFKTNINLYAKATITFILLGIASLFMFFNFSSYIKSIISWFKFREIKINDDKMIEFLGVEKIENGTIHIAKGKKYL